MHSIDLSVFLFINDSVGRYGVLDTYMVLLTNQVVQFFLIAISVYVIVVAPLRALGVREMLRSMKIGVIYTVAIAVTGAVVHLLKHTIAAPRPFMVLRDISVLAPYQEGYSFPSMHTALTTAVATILWCYYPRIGKPFAIIAALVGFSRVYVGVHYPIDVVVGALIGIAMAGLVYIGFSSDITPQPRVDLRPKKS
jgi:membrane-associated phospholipid phosphatase